MRHFVQIPALQEITASSRAWREAMQRASLRLLAAADAVFDPQLAMDQTNFVAQFNEMMQQPLQLLASDDAVKSVTVIVGQALWDVAWEPLVKSVAADAAVVRDCSCSMLRHRLKSVEAAGAKPLKKGPGSCSFIVDPRAEGSSSTAGGGMVALFKASVHKQSSDWTGIYGDDHIPSGYEWQKSVLTASSFLFCGFCRLSSSCPLQLLAGINTKALMLASLFAAAVNETALRRQGRLETILTPQEKQVRPPLPSFCTARSNLIFLCLKVTIFYSKAYTLSPLLCSFKAHGGLFFSCLPEGLIVLCSRTYPAQKKSRWMLSRNMQSNCATVHRLPPVWQQCAPKRCR
jgi:hypothetical protein